MDTPGFDDSERSDTEILLEIFAWLSMASTSKFKLAGINYLLRIPDVRIGGLDVANLKMFRGLCGDTNLRSVVLVTTMWDQMDRKTGENREARLKQDTNPWASNISHGSKVLRQDNKKVSGLEILRYLIGRRTKVTLNIQRELVEENKALNETEAGHAFVTEMVRLREQYETRLAALEVQLEEARKHWNEAQEAIEKKTKKLEKKLAQQHEDKIKLQANHDQIVADEKKRFKQQIQEQEVRHALHVGQQVEDEQKRLKAKYIKIMRERQCIVM